MLDFNSFVERHGEHTAQSIIERMERYEGVSPRLRTSLEERWIAIMGMPLEAPAQAQVA